jgi:hypothetical protein
MGGTLFALVAYFNSTERLSQQLRRRSSIHGLHGSMSSQTAIGGCLRRVSIGDQGLLLRCENGTKWL